MIHAVNNYINDLERLATMKLSMQMFFFTIEINSFIHTQMPGLSCMLSVEYQIVLRRYQMYNYPLIVSIFDDLL